MRMRNEEDLMAELEVSDSVRDATKRCMNGFSCLRKETTCLCKVEYSLHNKRSPIIIFVQYDGQRICNYKMSFGFSYVCTCPTRKEIFEKYRI